MKDQFQIKLNELNANDFIGLPKSIGWGANRKYDLSKVE
jgi:hypothetical protein